MTPFNTPPLNPFDPTTQDYQPGTPPLAKVIKDAINSQLLDCRVCLPCRVTAVTANQTVTVQPMLQSRYFDNSIVNVPQIQMVPVSMPMGYDYSIKLPIAIGDTGYCIFSDRSLDNWLAGDGTGFVDPQDTRNHFLSDAIFVPGLVPFANQTTDQTTDMVLTNGEAVLRIQKAGTFQIKNPTQELISNLVNLVQTLSTASTVAGGPFIPSVVLALTQIAENLQTLEGS